MPIENKLISKSIESAQKKVEANNFDTRKHLVEYDDVINKHREGIYRRRNEILLPDAEFKQIILGMVENEIEQIVSFHTASDMLKDWNLGEIYQVARTIFPVEEKLKEDLTQIAGENNKLNKANGRTKIIEHLVSMAKAHYGKLEEAALAAGIQWPEVEKQILIRSIDLNWIEHLEAMDYMRRGIGLRGYGQRDPLIEYKKEAFRMYNELNTLIQKQVVYSVFKVGDMQVAQSQQNTLLSRQIRFSAPAKEMSKGGSEEKTEFVTRKQLNDEGEKIGRNDPCPCKSGKKYKRCCGAN